MWRGLRWLARWAPRIGIAIVILLVIAWFVAVACFDTLAKFFLSRLKLNVKIEIGSAALSWKQIEVHKIRLVGPDGKDLLTADRGVGRWYLGRGLTLGGWHWLGDADVEKVDANFLVDRAGKFNWGVLEGEPGKGPPPFWTEYHGRVTAHDAILNYKDDRDGGFYYSIDKCTGYAVFEPGQPVQVGGLSDDPVLPWGSAQGKPPGQGGPPSAVAGHPRTTRAQLNGRFWPLHPQLDAHFSALDWPMEEAARYPIISAQVTVHGGVASGQLWLHGKDPSWNKLWKEMVREVRLQMEQAEAQFPFLPTAIKNIHGELGWEAGTIDTPGLVGDYLGGRARMRGRLSTSKEGGEGRLIIKAKGIDLARLSKYVKAEVLPLGGRVDGDVLLEGFVRSPSASGTMHSQLITVKGKQLGPLALNFQWSGGALHIESLTAAMAGGNFSAKGWIFPGKITKSGPKLDKVQLLLTVKASNAQLQKLAPGLNQGLRADGTLTVLGSPLDPVVLGSGSLRGLAMKGLPVEGGEGNLMVDKGGAILYDAKLNSPLGGLNLPWLFYDFRQKFAAANIVANNVTVPAGQGLAAKVSASLTVSGRLEDSRSWIATGQVAQGQASMRGQTIDNVHGAFLYRGGELSTSGMGADWGGGHVAVVGEYDPARRLASGVVEGQHVCLKGLGNSLSGLPIGAAPADFSAALDSRNGQAEARGWFKSAELSASALAFGNSIDNLKAMVWFDKLDPRRLGMKGVPGPLRGQLALESQGARQKVYYDAVAGKGQKNEVRLLGEASGTTQGSWRPGATWLTFPGNVVSQVSPVILEGGAQPYHGPEQGLALRPVVPIGADVVIPERSGDNRGMLAMTPAQGNYQVFADGLDLVPLSRLIGVDLNRLLHRSTGLDLVTAGFSASGTVQIKGKRLDAPGAIGLDLAFKAPWVQLRKSAGDPVALSMSGSMRTDAHGSLRGETRLAPQPYAQPGAPGELKVAGLFMSSLPRLHGKTPPESLDLSIYTHDFPVEVVRPLMPPAWSAFVPSGRLDAQDLRLWGDVQRPSLAGSLALHSGRVWLHQQPVDVDEARLKLSSGNGEVRIDEMAIQAGPLKLEGQGGRDKDGRLAGLVKLHQIPLSFLDPLGRPWSDIDGQVEAQVAFQGQGLVPNEFFASLTGTNLVYTPSGPGRSADPLFIDSLTVGKAPTKGEGVHLRLEAGQIVIDFPPDSMMAVLRAQATHPHKAPTSPPALVIANPAKPPAISHPVAWVAGDAAGMAALRLIEPDDSKVLGGTLGLTGQVRLKSLPGKDPAQWLQSALGPVFGDGKNPMVFSWQGLSQPLLERYLTWTPEIQGESSGQLRLLGQLFQTQQAKSDEAQGTFAELILQQLHLHRGQASDEQTLEISDPLKVSYQRSESATWLHVEPFRLLLGKSASGQKQAGELSGAIDIPVTRLNLDGAFPGKNKKGERNPSLRLQAKEMPLEMLSAFFPFLAYGSGTIHDLTIDAEGDRFGPQIKAELHLGPGSLGGVKFAKVDGRMQGVPEENGRYRLNFSSPTVASAAGKHDSGLEVFLGTQVSANHHLFLDGGVDLAWERNLSRAAQGSLQPVWAGYHVSGASTLELHAELIDEQAELLASLLPNSQTGGTAAGSLDIKGNLSEPQLAGSFSWTNGSLTYPWLGAPLTGITLATRFERIASSQAEPSSQGLLNSVGAADGSWLSRYSLDKFSGLWGTSSFQGKGKVELLGLQPTYLDVNFDGKALPLKFGDYFKGQGDVALKLLGSLDPATETQSARLVPTLTGKIDVPQGDITIPEALGTPGSQWDDFWKQSPVRYDIALNAGDNVWAYYQNSSVRGQGSLKILPSPSTGAPVLAGEIFLSRGTITIPLYEANFRLRQGYAIFDNDLLPTLKNVEADSTLGSYQITARVDGKYPNVHVQMFSNPPLANNELQNLVGYEGGQSTPGMDYIQNQQNQSLISSQGVTMLSNLLTGSLVQGIGKALFLSEVSFDFLPPAQYIVRVAKAIDSRDTVLLTFSQVLSNAQGPTNEENGSQNYGVEWRFQPNLLTRVTVDNFGQAKLWFQGLLKF